MLQRECPWTVVLVSYCRLELEMCRAYGLADLWNGSQCVVVYLTRSGR